MFIQTEATPNPATIKFLPGQPVLEKGVAEFKSPQEAIHAPLAKRLFAVQGVDGVFYGSDFVSVTKADDTDWSMLKPMILGALMEHLSTAQPIILDAYFKAQDDQETEEDDEISAQIRELIETRVRPMVAMDGGDIEFESFKDGVVMLRMRGACAGCPSSTMTLKSGIENMLKHFVPEVTEVLPVQDY